MHRFIQVMLAVLLVGVVLAGPVNAAPADIIVGNGTPGTCTEGNFDTAVVAGGTITFNCGVPMTIQLTSPAFISHDTTIDGGSTITLTGNLATQLFTVGVGKKLLLRNITLDKGYANHNAGGAIVSAGNLTLDNATIQNSVADQVGGAIWASGPITIRDSRLRNNASGKSGGAIFEQNAAALTIDNSTFANNSAQDATTGVGGAIVLGNFAQLTMTGGSLYNNQAVLDGGALHLSAGATATFLPGASGGTAFTSNSALAYGGAISNNGGVLNLNGANLSFNRTLTDTVLIGFGGAIDGEGAMSIVNSTFNTNQGRFGGAVYVGSNLFAASADIQHALFIGNSAAQYGGALFADTVTTTVTIQNTSIEFNSAAFGGGIERINAHLNILKSSITSNTAQNGGGLALASLPPPASGPYVEIRDSTISDNLATSTFGGGINNSALLDLVNVTVAANHDGLYNAGSGTIARLQSTVVDNPGFADCRSDGTVVPTSAGHNLATDNSCNLSTGNHDQSNTDAKLGALTSDPAVFTQFHLPQAASPLIGNGGLGCAASDQRYALRVGACDIGAIQLNGLLPRIFMPLVRK